MPGLNALGQTTCGAGSVNGGGCTYDIDDSGDVVDAFGYGESFEAVDSMGDSKGDDESIYIQFQKNKLIVLIQTLDTGVRDATYLHRGIECRLRTQEGHFCCKLSAVLRGVDASAGRSAISAARADLGQIRAMGSPPLHAFRPALVALRTGTHPLIHAMRTHEFDLMEGVDTLTLYFVCKSRLRVSRYLSTFCHHTKDAEILCTSQ